MTAQATETQPESRRGRGSGYTKVSLTLPSELLARLREEAGPGHLSSFVADILARDERRRALRQYVDAMRAEHGPAFDEKVQEVLRRWDAEGDVR
jgi:hypothetical protein